MLSSIYNFFNLALVELNVYDIILILLFVISLILVLITSILTLTVRVNRLSNIIENDKGNITVSKKTHVNNINDHKEEPIINQAPIMSQKPVMSQEPIMSTEPVVNQEPMVDRHENIMKEPLFAREEGFSSFSEELPKKSDATHVETFRDIKESIKEDKYTIYNNEEPDIEEPAVEEPAIESPKPQVVPGYQQDPKSGEIITHGANDSSMFEVMPSSTKERVPQVENNYVSELEAKYLKSPDIVMREQKIMSLENKEYLDSMNNKPLSKEDYLERYKDRYMSNIRHQNYQSNVEDVDAKSYESIHNMDSQDRSSLIDNSLSYLRSKDLSDKVDNYKRYSIESNYIRHKSKYRATTNTSE